MSILRAAAILALASIAAPALAETPAPLNGAETLSFGTQARPERTVFFTALLGIQSKPAYFGSDELTLGPQFKGSVGFVNFAGVNIGQPRFEDDPYERPQGFGARASFRFIGARESGDYDELDGLDDIDPTLELGLGAGYIWPNFEVYADARYGIGGSDAWVGELGANYVARPTDRLSLRIGPRFLYGSENYTDTYFGISDEEAARSQFGAYDPEGGLVSAGVEMIATYRLGERWWLEGGAKWERYQGDAADSPIVQNGSEEATEVRIGIRRAFVLEF